MTMTTLAPEWTLTESLQAIIDARLDTIERMLQGRVPRGERSAIVHEVESQIHELLAGRDPHLITNDDVLDVLRRLDPPEAYLSNDELGGPHRPPARRPMSAKPFLQSAPGQPIGAREGKLGGFLGIGSLALLLMVPVFYFIIALSQSEILAYICFALLALFAFVAAVSGLVFSIRGRREGVLPIFGIVGAAIALPIWMLGTILVLMNINS